MKFSSIRIVLVATSHPGNIGATARAMKTMGFTRLYLVNPKEFPDFRATEMAAGADDVLENCQSVPSLYEAIKECQLVIGTSARPRELSLAGLVPKDCAMLVAKQAEDTEVAIVFGNERSGLSNAELALCHFHVNIPANPDYSSLNLAQAVQIIVYELRMHLHTPLEASKQVAHATVQEIEYFYTHLFEVLLLIKFLKPKNLGRVQHRIRRLFNRVRLEKMEVTILRGIFSHVQKMLKGEVNQ